MDNTNFNEIFIPVEDKKKTGCCWRLFCPCYYLFCCCLCCEQGIKVTKMRFVSRFQKWISIKNTHDMLNSQIEYNDPVRGLIKLYAHKLDAIADL